MNPVQRLWHAEDGAELVEFALVLPLLLLVLLGIAEFGFMFQRYEVITNAAREGARLAVLPGYQLNDFATVRSRVQTYVTAGQVPTTASNPTVVVTTVPVVVGGGLPAINARRVVVTYTHTYMFLPGVGRLFGTTYSTVPLTAAAEMRVEVNN